MPKKSKARKSSKKGKGPNMDKAGCGLFGSLGSMAGGMLGAYADSLAGGLGKKKRGKGPLTDMVGSMLVPVTAGMRPGFVKA